MLVVATTGGPTFRYHFCHVPSDQYEIDGGVVPTPYPLAYLAFFPRRTTSGSAHAGR